MTRPRHYRQHIELRTEGLLPMLFAAALLLAWDGTGILRISLLCAVLHESGHLAAWFALVQRWPRVTLSLWGIQLSMRGVWLPTEQELLLAAAGPAVNLLCSTAVMLWMEWVTSYTYRGYWFASANLLVGGLNLLPLPGLDGGRILTCLLEPLRKS